LLVALFVLAVCIGVAAATTWLITSSRKAELERAHAQTRNLAEAMQQHVTQSAQEVAAKVDVVLQTLESADPPVDDKHLTALLQRLENQSTAVREIWVNDLRAGRVLTGRGKVSAERSETLMTAAGSMAGYSSTDLQIGRPVRSGMSGEWVLPMTRTIFDDNGRARYAVIGGLRLRHLEAFFERLDLGPRGRLTLLSSNARVLARQPFDVNELDQDLSATPSNQSYMQQSTRGSFESLSPIDGVYRLVNFIHLSDFPLIAVAAVAVDDEMAGWRAASGRAAAVAALICLVVGGSGWVLVHVLRQQQRLHDSVRASNRRLQDLKAALDAHAIVAVTDTQGRILQANAKFCEISGWAEDELLGRTHAVLKSGLHTAAFYSQLWRTISRGEVWRGEVCNRRRDGSLYWVDSTIVPFLDSAGKPHQYISIRADITARKSAEADVARSRDELAHLNAALDAQAHTDGLTGVANRRGFDKTLASELLRASRVGVPVSVLLLDVDHFKRYNDEYGHPAGDACLKQIGAALQRTTARAGDCVARYGGEEFAIVLPGVLPQDAMKVATRVLDAVRSLALPHVRSEHGTVTVSIGVHGVQTDGRALPPSPDALLSCCDVALYEAKAQGRNGARLFTSSTQMLPA